VAQDAVGPPLPLPVITRPRSPVRGGRAAGHDGQRRCGETAANGHTTAVRRVVPRVAVFATDRASGEVFPASNRLWGLLGLCLQALGGFAPDPSVGIPGTPGTSVVPWPTDGYLPARVAHRFGRLLFEGLGTLVVTCRPVPGRPAELVPVAVAVAGSPAVDLQRREGEQLSAYDTELAGPALAFAAFCTGSSGLTMSTLRPPAPGDRPSRAAAARTLERSGLVHHHGRVTTPARSSR
jgi:hypothetical protein